jgi:hypothetical protein
MSSTPRGAGAGRRSESVEASDPHAARLDLLGEFVAWLRHFSLLMTELMAAAQRGFRSRRTTRSRPWSRATSTGRGLVSRAPGAAPDRRAVIVTTTSRGDALLRAMLEAAEPDAERFLRAIFR